MYSSFIFVVFVLTLIIIMTTKKKTIIDGFSDKCLINRYEDVFYFYGPPNFNPPYFPGPPYNYGYPYYFNQPWV